VSHDHKALEKNGVMGLAADGGGAVSGSAWDPVG